MVDFFRPMLTVGIENDHQIKLPLEPVTQSGFNRFAFALILFVNDHLRTGFARALGGFIGRSIIDHENIIELLSRPADDFTDVFLLVVGGNDRSNAWLIQRRFCLSVLSCRTKRNISEHFSCLNFEKVRD